MANKELVFFIYNHGDREFKLYTSDKKKMSSIMESSNPVEISGRLEKEEIDGVLVLNEEASRWILVYASSLGIVGQRTARRQADTIVRSGYRMPDGYWLRGDYPMDELTEANIGDLWRTVQQKYVKTDLTGMEIDQATNLPSVLADRAKILEGAGHSDDLTEAKLEKEEAALRKKAQEKTYGQPAEPARKSSPPPKKSAPPKEEKMAAPPAKTPIGAAPKPQSAPKPAPVTASSGTSSPGHVLLEINAMNTFVRDGFTQIICKGNITTGTESPKSGTVIFDQSKISLNEWSDTVMFLKEGDTVEITTTTTDDGMFARTIKS
ncbi:MAG: hypothetical protein OEZ01_04770 [Candidatus Heimdallarchaeota archaeon]|nr:hypothetical protein [Candidatus Heimdallarchaeota archaeon]MDH5645294.1 hypothetical protein [Candidatus Heimdallarchaeota archaeon]